MKWLYRNLGRTLGLVTCFLLAAPIPTHAAPDCSNESWFLYYLATVERISGPDYATEEYAMNNARYVEDYVARKVSNLDFDTYSRMVSDDLKERLAKAPSKGCHDEYLLFQPSSYSNEENAFVGTFGARWRKDKSDADWFGLGPFPIPQHTQKTVVRLSMYVPNSGDVRVVVPYPREAAERLRYKAAKKRTPVRFKARWSFTIDNCASSHVPIPTYRATRESPTSSKLIGMASTESRCEIQVVGIDVWDEEGNRIAGAFLRS